MYKNKQLIIVSVFLSIILIFLVLDWQYSDDFEAYNSGKFHYETVGKYGNTLASAHTQFLEANGFWDSEDYIQKLEDEMYVELKEVMKDQHFSKDGVLSSIKALKSSVRYKDIAEDWDKQIDESFEQMKAEEKKRIARNPPYVGMPRAYVTETSWGSPTLIKKGSYPYETTDTATYYWEYYEGYTKKVKVVYVIRGKVIKVNE